MIVELSDSENPSAKKKVSVCKPISLGKNKINFLFSILKNFQLLILYALITNFVKKIYGLFIANNKNYTW